MPIQYISNDKGTTTGVFIPIQEWDKLKDKILPGIEETPLSAIQVEELKYRIDDFLAHPEGLLEWEDIKKHLLNRNHDL